MNNTEQDVIKISLKSLFLYPLYHWKKLLALTLLFVLLGSTFISIKAYKMANAAESGQNLQLDLELKKYEENKQYLEERQKVLENAIVEQKKYLDESIWIQLDPYKVWKARYSIYVDTDYKIMPDLIYQNPDQAPIIAGALCELLSGGAQMEKLAENLGMNFHQLKELYQVNVNDEQIVVIDVTADTEDRVIAIMDALKEELRRNGSKLRSSFCDFTMKEVQDTHYTQADKQIIEYKNKFLASLKENQEEVLKVKQDLSSLTMPTSLKEQTGKHMFFLLLAAVILPYGCYCVHFVCKNKLYSEEELADRWSIVSLGAIATDRKRSVLERKIRRLERRAAANDAGAYSLTAYNLRNYCGEKVNLLVTGDAPDEICRSVTEKLQAQIPDIKLQYHGSLLSSAESLEALRTCEGVVLIEQCGTSKLSSISREVRRIQDIRKDLIGAIVID